MPAHGFTHETPGGSDLNDWITPPEIVKALAPFDLDPCAAQDFTRWPTAHRHITLPDDGLAADWGNNFVWLNPPYRGSRPWIKKLATHKAGGIALLFARTETATWQQWVFPFATAILFRTPRIKFYEPDGTLGKKGSTAGSAFIAYGLKATSRLIHSKIEGRIVCP